MKASGKMILTELIKKLEELNSDSSNSVKSVKVFIETEDGDYTVDISEVVSEEDCIELKWNTRDLN